MVWLYFVSVYFFFGGYFHILFECLFFCGKYFFHDNVTAVVTMSPIIGGDNVNAVSKMSPIIGVVTMSLRW